MRADGIKDTVSAKAVSLLHSRVRSWLTISGQSTTKTKEERGERRYVRVVRMSGSAGHGNKNNIKHMKKPRCYRLQRQTKMLKTVFIIVSVSPHRPV